MNHSLLASLCVVLLALTVGCSDEGLQRNVWNASADGNQGAFEEHERFTWVLEQVYEPKSDSVAFKDITGAIQTPLVMEGERVIAADASGNVYSAVGEMIEWKYRLPNSEAVMTGMMADSAGNVYVLTQSGRLLSLDANGRKRLDTLLFDGSHLRIYSHVQRLRDGRMLFACSDGRVRCLDTNGRIVWARNHVLEPMSHIACLGNRVVLPLTSMNTHEADSLVCLDADGNIVWSKEFAHTQLTAPPVLTASGVYIGGKRASNSDLVNVVWRFGMMGEANWSIATDYTPRNLSVGEDGHVLVSGRSTGIGAPISAISYLDPQGKVLWAELFGAKVIGQPLLSQQNLVFSAVTDSTYGLVYMNKQGEVEHKLSLTAHPILRMNPVVDGIGNIILLSTENRTHARIGQSALLRMLP